MFKGMPHLDPAPIEVPNTLDGKYTRDLVVAALGESTLHNLEETHQPTVAHMMGTGDLVALFLAQNSFTEELCEEGARHGGLHDFGKFRSDILAQVVRTDDYGPKVRQWVTMEHSSEGARRLLALSISRPILRGTAFTAQHHHSEIPDGYYHLPANLAEGWGRAHVTKIADVLHAIHFDRSRAYVAKREGRTLSNQDKFNIIMQARGGHDPVIEGEEVVTVPILREILGV